MNLVDAEVIEIMGEPYKINDFYAVDVKINCYGSESIISMIGDSPEDVMDKVWVGRIIQV